MIYLDSETTRFFADPEIKALPRSQQIPALAAHVGCVVTYAPAADGWRAWGAGEMIDLWAYLIGEQICGWNTVGFDIPLLQHAAALAGAPDPGLDPYSSLDLFAELRTRTGRWYKLEEIAQANLGVGKSGDGQQAAAWLRSGDPALIARAADYCRRDVQLVVDLHTDAQTAGLVCPPRPRDTAHRFYRWWCNQDGSAWKTEIETMGQWVVYDQEHWPG